jgi:hypothetical protein
MTRRLLAAGVALVLTPRLTSGADSAVLRSSFYTSAVASGKIDVALELPGTPPENVLLEDGQE